MVGYVFLFNNAVRFAKKMISEGQLGDIYYVHGVRTNLGPIRIDSNSLWDLASHDISIMLYWLEQNPVTVNANGARFLGNPFEDVALAQISFEKRQYGFLHVSWLDPCKVRQITVVGSNKMLLFDDMSPSEPIKIYNKGVTRETFYDSYGSHRMSVRSGDIVIPPITAGEPLFNECEAFVDAVLDNRRNDAIGLIPLQVDSILQAMDESLAGNGMPTEVKR
jgi:predicted dehydrogenase